MVAEEIVKRGVDIKECFHCGEDCAQQGVIKNDHNFCCTGCAMVYDILSENGLSSYYSIDSDNTSVGIRPRNKRDYSFLQNESIVSKLLDYESEEVCKITLDLPTIHCSSCIWLLENIGKLDKGIINARVNYLKKKCSISYNPLVSSLEEIITILSRIGFDPELNYKQVEDFEKRTTNRSIYYKIGVAGFSFGNIMLLSFPEYLGLGLSPSFKILGYLNILLAAPVLLYSASDYLRSAWSALMVRKLGIDIPIVIGMLVLFFRSLYEIITQIGPGYLDSFTGFVLFLLVGKWFQSKTFQSISFDREYSSFFPIAVLKKQGSKWKYQNIKDLVENDIITIKNEEIIPCDGKLVSDRCKVDYSFVTGEERLKLVTKGEQLYAGGKLSGKAISIIVSKAVDQSYLTQLWNEETFAKDKLSGSSLLINQIGEYFVYGILALAAMTFLYWINVDIGTAMKATTAVLIIACPCVLALSVPFIYGTMLRVLGRHGVYSRNTGVLEHMSGITSIVFDKTGTLTNQRDVRISFDGNPLSKEELLLMWALTSQSSHPLSKAITKELATEVNTSSKVEITNYNERIGAGLEGMVNGHWIRMGSPAFLLHTTTDHNDTEVLIEIDQAYKGRYTFSHELRSNVAMTINNLSSSYHLALLSGDHAHDRERMKEIFPNESPLLFNQSPINKLNYIKSIQSTGSGVMMIGDGLNDAGALKQSDIGIVVSEASNNFTPACDLIFSGKSFEYMSRYLSFIKKGRGLLYGAFVFAFIYNAVGLYFAMTGQLSPVVAAILMPISSLSIMAYGILSTELLARKLPK